MGIERTCLTFRKCWLRSYKTTFGVNIQFNSIQFTCILCLLNWCPNRQTEWQIYIWKIFSPVTFNPGIYKYEFWEDQFSFYFLSGWPHSNICEYAAAQVGDMRSLLCVLSRGDLPTSSLILANCRDNSLSFKAALSLWNTHIHKCDMNSSTPNLPAHRGTDVKCVQQCFQYPSERVIKCFKGL